MSAMFDQMFGNLTALMQRQRMIRSGGGSRGQIARQVSAAKKAIMQTPQGRALVSECQKKVMELQAPLDQMNVGNVRWQSNPDILTGNCRITFESYEPGGGGGD